MNGSSEYICVRPTHAHTKHAAVSQSAADVMPVLMPCSHVPLRPARSVGKP